MKFKVVKLGKLCGARCSIYSVLWGDDKLTLFDNFIIENKDTHTEEVKNILQQIRAMADKTGAKEHLFEKPEGKAGQGVWALFDKPKSTLRLYVFRVGSTAIVMGGGGLKPKTAQKFQEIPKLKIENDLVRTVSDQLTKRILEKEIRWSTDGLELEGDLFFEE